MFSTELSDRDFRRFSTLVYEKCGINLHQGKKELVRARLGKRLRETGFRDFNAYYKFVTQKDSGDELVRMLDAISTNLTSFFREKKHFDFLKEVVFPTYVAGKNRTAFHRPRFWSAGCSTGEEPYSLAIWLLEYFGKSPRFDVKILARMGFIRQSGLKRYRLLLSGRIFNGAMAGRRVISGLSRH